MRHTHQPVIAVAEESSGLRAFFRFLVPAIVYSIRHLTFGSLVRLRRLYLRSHKRTWWIE
jgi:hypothetical protein